ncbi:MAG: hypothetical protein IKL44_06940 [Clostridia bacterium]|nr:hypothetical protein [Clostridia bacterium]
MKTFLKTLSICLTFLILSSLIGCSGKKDSADSSSKDAIVSDTESTVSDTDSTVSDNVPSLPASTVKEPVLSPKSAVEIYMANKDVWMHDLEATPMNGYGYCLLDLDFDGVLELICSLNDGSGRFSYNSYYKINISTKKVEKLDATFGTEGDFDVYYLQSKETKLFSGRDGQKFYYCADFSRVSSGEYGTTYGKMYLKDKKVQAEYLFYDYFCDGTMAKDGKDVKEYGYYEDGEGVKLSKNQYDEKFKKFGEDNADLQLNWKSISGDEFHKANDATKKQQLLATYKAFSYSGFSFDKIKTYDVKVETANTSSTTATPITKLYKMAEYNGMTIADVAKMWGNDYKIANGLYFGGWGAIYYSDDKCPLVFCFSASDIPTSCTGKEKLAGVLVYPRESDKVYCVTGDVSIVASYEQVSKKLQGDYYYNEMDGGNAYSGELANGVGFTYKWIESPTLPYEVGVFFN